MPKKNTLRKNNSMRDQFHIPKQANGDDEIYLCGNSLGLQPKRTQGYIDELLDDWRRLGVKGHHQGDYPWLPYHKFLLTGFADLVGAKESEVVPMNTLTVNLHLLMVSFYRPTKTRYKILVEDHAFPSDHIAVDAQLRFHADYLGFDPKEAMLIATPREGEDILRTEDILDLIEQHADELALVMLPGVQYYTGQIFDMQSITTAGHAAGAKVGFDLAHAAGNIPMHLHDWDVDFAAWCSYKYLNSGPGSVAGAYVHERHHRNKDLHRFTGWWGHDESTRFLMKPEFKPIPSVQAWQCSNPTILSLAAIRASLDVFAEAGGIESLSAKSNILTGHLRHRLEKECAEIVDIITPQHSQGCQLSLALKTGARDGKKVFDYLIEQGVSLDWREPNGIRVAPVPLYNTREDVDGFVEFLQQAVMAL
ncbi:MAG: kynureninase [Gammaproteobacteria bacterium]|nr:kynureninase [Gammaproteobacteria bacterium]NNC97863.1 kynureninase [Gammaproteobacteria bacterium]NNM12933.1 kynureninase [Gammaproteobacteria bacterium]